MYDSMLDRLLRLVSARSSHDATQLNVYLQRYPVPNSVDNPSISVFLMYLHHLV